MTLFELVKLALDELYAQGKKEHGGDLDKRISEKIEYLSASYKKLNDDDRESVDYKDPATRFAYVFSYVAAHGDYLVQVLQQLSAGLKAPIFNEKSVRVSCVGGGPGSDIIAVLKYLDEYKKSEKVEKVTCYLLDREQAWADTWTELDESLKEGVLLNANFQPLDVTDPNSWKFQQKFLQADLFTMSYFVSEVRSLDKDGVVTKFWTTLFERAKSGALFAYVDNGHKSFNEYFDGLVTKAGFERIVFADNVAWTPRYFERAATLKEYQDKFGRQPKLKSYLSFRGLRKP